MLIEANTHSPFSVCSNATRLLACRLLFIVVLIRTDAHRAQAYRQHWVTNVTEELVQLQAIGVSGVSLDVEHFHGHVASQTKRLFGELVCDLHTRLAQRGLILHSICTKIWGDTTHFDLLKLSQCAEYLLPMAYGAHTAFTLLDLN